jgi:AraC-like DNA-binding protein
MNYLSRSPAPVLAGSVEYIWQLSDAPAHAREKILPSGTLELVINLHENEFRIYDVDTARPPRRFSGAIASGAYQHPFVIDTREHAGIVGVHFRPGGALPFLGALPSELSDLHVDLDALWGHAATELRERLCEAGTPEQRLLIVEQTLTARLRCPRARHRAVPFAVAALSETHASVSQLASVIGLSHRRLIEVFSAEVGMTPKRFARVRRFQRAVALAQRSPSPDWAGLAHDCGYSDQSHLIREFVAFSGLAPEDLRRHRDDPVKENHLALA